MVSEKRFEELEKKVKNLEKENKKLRKQLESDNGSEKQSKREISRRNFLKKLGAGVAAAGTMSLAPAASQLKLTKNGISSSSGLNFLDSGQEYFNISDGGPVEVSGTDLRISTGNSIRDGEGNKRFELRSNDTQINDDNGNRVMFFRNPSATQGVYRVEPKNGANWKVKDQHGGFDAYEYKTSSSAPGTLDMTKALLDHGNDPAPGSSNKIRQSTSAFREEVGKMEINDSNSHALPFNDSRGFALIHGKGSSQQFTDMVMWNYSGSAVVLGQSQHEGPPGRSYSTSGHDLIISFDSDPGETITIRIRSMFTSA